MQWYQKYRENPNLPPRPLIIGHRGAGGLATENTLAAFELATNLGVDVIECDVQLTADGEVVIFHDDTLERLTKLDGCIQNYSWKELQTSAVVTDQHGSQPIPRLEELCQFLQTSQIRLLVEMKTLSAIEPALSLLSQYHLEKRTVVGCFQEEGVIEILTHGAFPAMRLVESHENFSKERWREERIAGVRLIGIPEKDVTHTIQHSIQGSKLAAWVWTVNDPEKINHAWQNNVDGIITDRPDLVLPLIEE